MSETNADSTRLTKVRSGHPQRHAESGRHYCLGLAHVLPDLRRQCKQRSVRVTPTLELRPRWWTTILWLAIPDTRGGACERSPGVIRDFGGLDVHSYRLHRSLYYTPELGCLRPPFVIHDLHRLYPVQAIEWRANAAFKVRYKRSVSQHV